MDPNLIGTCVKKGANLFSIGLGSKSNPSKAVIQVAWKRPPMGWIILNSDGLAMGNPSKARCGAFFITVRENG